MATPGVTALAFFTVTGFVMMGFAIKWKYAEDWDALDAIREKRGYTESQVIKPDVLIGMFQELDAMRKEPQETGPTGTYAQRIMTVQFSFLVAVPWTIVWIMTSAFMIAGLVGDGQVFSHRIDVTDQSNQNTKAMIVILSFTLFNTLFVGRYWWMWFDLRGACGLRNLARTAAQLSKRPLKGKNKAVAPA